MRLSAQSLHRRESGIFLSAGISGGTVLPRSLPGIYLAGLRYNLHLKPRALLLEAGAQTNTVEEVRNAMEPFADILNRVLKGSDKRRLKYDMIKSSMEKYAF